MLGDWLWNSSAEQRQGSDVERTTFELTQLAPAPTRVWGRFHRRS